MQKQSALFVLPPSDEGGGVDRVEPNGGKAHLFDVVELLQNSLQIADPVCLHRKTIADRFHTRSRRRAGFSFCGLAFTESSFFFLFYHKRKSSAIAKCGSLNFTHGQKEKPHCVRLFFLASCTDLDIGVKIIRQTIIYLIKKYLCCI